MNESEQGKSEETTVLDTICTVVVISSCVASVVFIGMLIVSSFPSQVEMLKVKARHLAGIPADRKLAERLLLMQVRKEISWMEHGYGG